MGLLGEKFWPRFLHNGVIEQSNLIPRVFSLSYRRHIGKREDPRTRLEIKRFFHMAISDAKESETSTTTGMV